MDQKIKIRKQAKISDNDSFESLTKEELIEKVISLSAHNFQLRNLLTKQTKGADKIVPKDQKPFDFSKYTFQHVALRIMYLGWDYKGYVVQEDTMETIEHCLFEALIKTKLIQDRATSNYHRCGRTDKGVSSFGQVISIDLRSNISSDDNKINEINYTKILNRVLPDNIQCIAWSPVDEKFSARFDCQSRIYKYYFPKGNMDIEHMIIAAKKLLGAHDFRNFCKMDVGNGVVEFTRNIKEISIEPLNKNESGFEMYVISIRSKAFLWHQIRCIMGLLFLIGQGKEAPEVVDELFNIEKCPRKPNYDIASEIPLNLYHCEYDNVKWIYDIEVLSQTIDKLNNAWTVKAAKESMIQHMIKSLKEITSNLEGDHKEKCLSEHLLSSKHKNYVPLLKRQTCHSLEDKIEHYKKRKRIEVVNSENK